MSGVDNEAEMQDKARERIGRLVTELVRLRNPDEDPVVVGWAVSYEFTSVSLEQGDQFGTGTAAPREQSGAMTRGLFDLGRTQFGASDD